jgi:hypothetical protein
VDGGIRSNIGKIAAGDEEFVAAGQDTVEGKHQGTEPNQNERC